MYVRLLYFQQIVSVLEGYKVDTYIRNIQLANALAADQQYYYHIHMYCSSKTTSSTLYAHDTRPTHASSVPKA